MGVERSLDDSKQWRDIADRGWSDDLLKVVIVHVFCVFLAGFAVKSSKALNREDRKEDRKAREANTSKGIRNSALRALP